jgi:subtilase family serine protease
MDADPTTGMLVGQTQSFPEGIHYGEYRIGGTSLASPLFAGIQALKTELNGGTRLGFANPALYKLAGSKQFTDVLPKQTGGGNVRPDFVNGLDASDGILYSVRTFDQDSSLMVTKGWDDVTGIGAPNAAYLGAK